MKRQHKDRYLPDAASNAPFACVYFSPIVTSCNCTKKKENSQERCEQRLMKTVKIKSYIYC